MLTLPSARVVAGRGLESDRYFLGTGRWSGHPKGGNEVTLIEAETIAALAEEGMCVRPEEVRRNIVTSGIRLSKLAGRTFRVGAVTLLGLRPADPCGYLEALTRPGMKQALKERGGLRAQVVEGGEIKPGDEVGALPDRVVQTGNR